MEEADTERIDCRGDVAMAKKEFDGYGKFAPGAQVSRGFALSVEHCYYFVRSKFNSCLNVRKRHRLAKEWPDVNGAIRNQERISQQRHVFTQRGRQRRLDRIPLTAVDLLPFAAEQCSRNFPTNTSALGIADFRVRSPTVEQFQALCIRSLFVFAEARSVFAVRSEEHTSELQSPCNLVCR